MKVAGAMPGSRTWTGTAAMVRRTKTAPSKRLYALRMADFSVGNQRHHDGAYGRLKTDAIPWTLDLQPGSTDCAPQPLLLNRTPRSRPSKTWLREQLHEDIKVAHGAIPSSLCPCVPYELSTGKSDEPHCNTAYQRLLAPKPLRARSPPNSRRPLLPPPAGRSSRGRASLTVKGRPLKSWPFRAWIAC